MKLKVAIIITVSMLLVLGFAATAVGQSWCDTVAVSTQYAQPGDTIIVSGSAYYGDNVTVTLDGVLVASAVADEYNEFSTSFVVPADATVGDHEIIVTEFGEGERSCTYPLAVAAANLAPAGAAPAATPATLPATGFMLMPAGLFMGAGIATLIYRKHRR